VRWAFGFGGEARVVDPPEAARLADNLLERMRDANASQSERRSETA